MHNLFARISYTRKPFYGANYASLYRSLMSLLASEMLEIERGGGPLRLAEEWEMDVGVSHPPPPRPKMHIFIQHKPESTLLSLHRVCLCARVEKWGEKGR